MSKRPKGRYIRFAISAADLDGKRIGDKVRIRAGAFSIQGLITRIYYPLGIDDQDVFVDVGGDRLILRGKRGEEVTCSEWVPQS